MTLPQVAAAIEDLQNAHRELLRVVDSLSDSDWERGVPYGEWTVKDLVAHCIGDMSPSGAGLILAGVLTPEFIAANAAAYDIRARNAAIVAERRRYTKEDLRQLLFESHDAMIAAMRRLDESHIPVLEYRVPMGEGYDLQVWDWLWAGYHDRQHRDDILRALEADYAPVALTFIPEIEQKMRALVRAHDGALRAVYSVADDAWEEPSSLPGWSYHDILAHLASNEKRRAARLRAAAGAKNEEDAALAAVDDADAWNEEQVKARRGLPVRSLVDEFVEGWYEVRQALAAMRPEHLDNPLPIGRGETIPVREFLDRMSAHTQRHAGQLTPASRRARWAP